VIDPAGASFSPRVMAPTLEDLVRHSDVIVVGEVKRIEHVHRAHDAQEEGAFTFDQLPTDVPIAEVRVTQVLLGTSDLGSVLFLAAPTWACDTSTAVVGESALLFLANTTKDKLFDDSLRRDIRRALPQGELMRIAWSGRGRLPLSSLGVCTSGVILPKYTPDEEEVHPGQPRFRGAVPLPWITALVQKSIEAQKKIWLRASVSEVVEGGVGWNLEIRLNRQAQLTIHEPGGDRETHFALDPNAYTKLEWDIRDLGTKSIPETLGTGHPRLGTRLLERFPPGADSKLRILSIDEEWMSKPERNEATQAVLVAWKKIRDLVDEPSCADHRPTDDRWISGNR
jgi:hypothetical protein